MFKRITKSRELDSKSFLQDLIDFHEEKPAVTEKTYGSSQTRDGKTSYEILADQVSHHSEKVIVDLACGNGPFIELLLKREQSVKKIIGIDLCQTDLEEAKLRCNKSNVDFCLSSATDLPMENRSVDIVFCHMAFFLFKPIDSVVREIARILKPEGNFAAILSGLEENNDCFLETVRILKETVGDEHPHLKDFGWGDPRANSKEGVSKLFSKDFESPRFFDFSLIVNERSAEKLAHRLTHYFYAFDLLSEKGRSFVLKEWASLFNNQEKLELLFPLTAAKLTKKS